MPRARKPGQHDELATLLRMLVSETFENRKAISTLATHTVELLQEIRSRKYSVTGHSKRVYNVPKAPPRGTVTRED
jgi:hypothetical protein